MLPSAGDVVVRPVRDGDAERLVADMRQCDRDEVRASSGPDLLAVVRSAIERTAQCLVAEHGQDLLFIGGVVLLAEGIGSPWVLGTTQLDQHMVSLTRVARRYLQEVMQTFPCLINFVDARNVRSVRWLSGLGFEVFPAAPYGVSGLPFHRFQIGQLPCVPPPQP